MAIRPLTRTSQSNVSLLQKARTGALTVPDTLRSNRNRKRGDADSTTGSFLSLQSERDRLSRLFNTYKHDIDIFAMVRQVMRRMPPWTLVETVPGAGDEQHKAVLDSLFHLPDGENTCQQIVRCTVARMKMVGKAHWVLRRLDEEALDEAFADGPVEALIARIREDLGLPANDTGPGPADPPPATCGFTHLTGSAHRRWLGSVRAHV